MTGSMASRRSARSGIFRIELRHSLGAPVRFEDGEAVHSGDLLVDLRLARYVSSAVRGSGKTRFRFQARATAWPCAAWMNTKALRAQSRAQR